MSNLSIFSDNNFAHFDPHFLLILTLFSQRKKKSTFIEFNFAERARILGILQKIKAIGILQSIKSDTFFQKPYICKTVWILMDEYGLEYLYADFYVLCCYSFNHLNAKGVHTGRIY